MGESKSVSFRTHLLSNVSDLLGEIEINCLRTANLIVSLVSALAAYTEEGHPLSPNVFICNSISQLMQRAGVGEHLFLSDHVPTDAAALQVLKSAAGLCGRHWHIFVERSADGQTCAFGVFSGSLDPSALDVDRILLEEYEPGFPIIKISQNVTNKVQVHTNRGTRIEFRFNADADIQLPIEGSWARQFASCMVASEDGLAEVFANFMERAFSAAVAESHGTLIAVLPATVTELPAQLKDAVRLNPPLDLYARLDIHASAGKTADSVGPLQAAVDLLAGFINSDGVTVLNASGKIIAFRAFVKQSGEAGAEGGSRKRAFSVLKAMVGSGLVAALFRSQDGETRVAFADKEGKNG